MAHYRIVINKQVRKKDLVGIPKADVKRIVAKINLLAKDPYPEGCVRLRGRDEWRIRQGNYRILYIVEESTITVYVVKVGHRKDIYR